MSPPTRPRLGQGQRSDTRDLIRRLRAEDGWLGELPQVFPAAGDGSRRVPSVVKAYTENLVDLNVTTAKINSGAVITEKINELAVTTNKLDALGVTTAKIAQAAVTQEKIAGDSVGEAEMKGSSTDDSVRAVTTNAIRNSAVVTEKIAGDAVTTARIAPLAVGTTKLADLAVSTDKLDALSVGTSKIIAGAVTIEKLAAPLSPANTNTADDTEYRLRRIGLGSGARAAGETHSHSTSQALRFEAMPAPARDLLLGARAIIRSQLASGAPLSAQELRAHRILLLGLCHLGLDGLSETAEERKARRASSPEYDAALKRRVLEMFYSEFQEGTTAAEEGVPHVHSANSEAAAQAVAEGKIPRFAKQAHPDLAA